MDATVNSHSRQEKLDFYVNTSGSNMWEIGVLTMVGPLAIMLRNLAIPWLFPTRRFKSNSIFDLSLKFICDFCMTCIPCLLGFTVLSDYPSTFGGTLIGLIVALMFFCFCEYVYSDRQRPPIANVLEFHVPSNTSYFVSYFRCFANLATGICILAVDFPIFPRRLAKTDLYGYSLMDVGVGIFVVANAIVSPEARQNRRLSLHDFRRSVVSAIPIVLLGVLRVVLLHITGYHHIVSEYGRHWNFFFTLACLKLISSFVAVLLPLHKLALPLSIVCAVSYQSLLLDRYGFKDLISNDAALLNRDRSFFHANLEGFLSTCGYMAIYFAGIWIGRFVFSARLSNLKSLLRLSLKFAVLLFMSFTLLIYCHNYVEQSSRRMANITYCLWIVFFSLQHLFLFLLVEITAITMTAFRMPLYDVGQEEPPSDPLIWLEPCLWKAINYNGLLFFLVANVFTGLVNLAFRDTHLFSVAQSLAILIVYTLLLCLMMFSLAIWDLRFKFW